jgi:hypothetical protein
MIINETKLNHLEELVKKVLSKTSCKKEIGLDKDIIITDCDHTRLYLKTEDKEFTIRTWNVEDIYNGKKGRVQWTLFVNIDDENGNGHGEELSCGISIITYDEKVFNQDMTPVEEGDVPF